jgi:hypothetical protein
MQLKEIAFARSGDKGRSVNIGVIGKNQKCYEQLADALTEKVVGAFFSHPPEKIKKYFWPKLFAINFILEEILDEGVMQPDSQGKAFAKALLELELEDGLSRH